MPNVDPSALLVAAAPEHMIEAGGSDAEHMFFAGGTFRSVENQWHGAIDRHGEQYHVWTLEDPTTLSVRAIVLPFDDNLELRLHAARQLWRGLRGRVPIGEFRPLTENARNWNILALRALDGRIAGATYRQLAEVLLGFTGNRSDWELAPQKSQVRRLVAHGYKMMRGGYLLFLRHPLK